MTTCIVGVAVNILNGGPGNDTLVSRGYSDVLIGRTWPRHL